jgi:hemerythrin-like domain-containing protein
MSKIVDALRKEHAKILTVLDILEREIEAFADGVAVDYGLIAAIVDYFTDFPDQQHHPKEDLIFARLRRADPAAASGVGDLPALHAGLAAELQAFAGALEATTFDEIHPRTDLMALARAFIDHQRLHLTMEELYFFPVAEQTLDPGAWTELDTAIASASDPLVGGTSGDKFEALRRTIVGWEAIQHPIAPRLGQS